MSNRKQRRAAAAQHLPELPEMPNISGTQESCANCRFSRNEEWRRIVHLLRLPAPVDDELLCLADPGGGRSIKTYGWCARYAPKLNG